MSTFSRNLSTFTVRFSKISMSLESIETVNIKIEIDLELVKKEPKCEEPTAVFIKKEPDCVPEEVVKEELKYAMDIEIEKEDQSNIKRENGDNLISIASGKKNPYESQATKCQICQETFSNVPHNCSENNILNVDSNETHCCDVCTRKFKNKHALDVHRRRHFNRKFACEICNIRFGNEINLKAHITDFHSGKEDKQSCFQCEKCPKRFWSKSHLVKHEAKHKDGSSLNEENSASIASAAPITTDIQPHKCPNCLKTFHNTALLSAHNCAPEKPHSCDVCTMKFKHKHTLNVHRSKHFNRIFACETCKIQFDNEIYLNAHFSDFHKEDWQAWFRCEKCNKQFRSKSHLVQHEMSHEVRDAHKS